MLNRRHFIAGAATVGVASAFAKPAFANGKPKVVIIGGGPGGGSVLRALASSAGDKLDITLIEPQSTYTTCFYSNLYLGGFQPLENLRHTYDEVKKLPGVTVAQDFAQSIDRNARTVTLAGGKTLSYDRLVVAPGIDIDYGSVPGWSKDAEERMPHAWKAGPQLELLKRQLNAVPDGGLIVMIAPPNPYRCPPGPYERISMMAHVLQSQRQIQSAHCYPRHEGSLLEATALPAGLGEALSRHDRVDSAFNSQRHKSGRSRKDDGRNGLRDV